MSDEKEIPNANAMVDSLDKKGMFMQPLKFENSFHKRVGI